MQPGASASLRPRNDSPEWWVSTRNPFALRSREMPRRMDALSSTNATSVADLALLPDVDAIATIPVFQNNESKSAGKVIL